MGSWLASDTDVLQLNARLGAPGPETSRTPYLLSIRVIRVIRGELFLLFFAEFLEGRIATQRVPHRVEPKKGERDRCDVIKAIIGGL